jgi:signal peptidase II
MQSDGEAGPVREAGKDEERYNEAGDTAQTRGWRLLIVLTLVGFFLDWLTKFLVASTMRPGQTIPLIGERLQIFFVYNTGAVFGLNPRALFPGFPVNAFFYLVSAIAIAVLVFYFRNAGRHETFIRWGVALIMPGALGNLFDRLVHPGKGVVDFIKMDFGFWPFDPWPIYNLADVYITFGVALLLLQFLREGRGESDASQQSSSRQQSSGG